MKIEIICPSCDQPFWIAVDKVRYGWARRGADAPAVLPRNRCPACAREHNRIHDDARREKKHREADLIKGRKAAAKRIANSPALQKFLSIKPSVQHERHLDRLFDQFMLEAEGRERHRRPYTPKILNPALRDVLLTPDPYLDGPVRGPAALGATAKSAVGSDV